MRVLDNVTLMCIDCYNYPGAVLALQKSMEQIGFAKVKFLTDIDMEIEGVEVVKIDRITSKESYSEFCLKGLYKHFDTDFVLICQHDGYVICGEVWDDEFFKYDYVAPKWTYTDGKNVGCGGASLRSKHLQTVLGEDDFIFASDPEDQAIGRLYRDYLIKRYDVRFATEDVADRFGYELNAPYCKTFCFHGYFHPHFKEHIVLKRTASMGDVIMLEGVIDHYASQGLQVVIDTIPEFMQVFCRYRHPLKHISQMDTRIKPVKEINFDYAYELHPMQRVQKSYADLTGEKVKIRNSKLDFPIEPGGKLLERTILIHIDETGMTHRNAQGVNWAFVVSYYTKLGYLVFQIGKRMGEQVAPVLNLANTEMLVYMIAAAELVIGIDSSPTQLAVALGTPAVIFFGSVRPSLRYVNFEKIADIHSPCEKEEDDFCYHTNVGVSGVKCKYNQAAPPCVQYTEWQVIKASNKLLNLN